MRRLRAASLAFSAVASLAMLSGCAAISGLDGISEQACAPDCDGGANADGTMPVGEDGSSGIDSTMTGEDSSAPDSTLPTDDSGMGMGGDTSTGADSARDSSDAEGPDGGHDATTGDADATITDSGHETLDSGNDTGTTVADTGVDTGVDAGVDSGGGCGPTNTTDNCSACGDKCVEADASAASCNGATCSYTCKTGFLDCNASSAPDTDGCECYAPGATMTQCCSGSCPQTHHWDLQQVGTTFYDCVTQGTINQSDAIDACNAYMGDTTHCDTGGISTFYCTYPDGGVVGDMVCSNGSTTKNCACWGYDGQLTGLMEIGTALPGSGGANCPCPGGGSPTWN